MTRLTTRLVLTGVLLFPAAQSFALGLGEIHLNSALNQPFDADIELISPTPDEVAGLKVSIANNDLFTRYGLDKAAYLSGFVFTVNQTRDGRAFVHIASNQSITEPFVTLLVEASWPRGRLLREYTVLLDPPVFSADKQQQEVAKAPAVEAPQSGARNEGRIERTPTPERATPVPSPVPAPSAPTSQAESIPAAASAGGEYRVKRNDTLFQIAKEIRPGSRQVVNQTMIALFRANPEAFQGNINRLRANTTLRVPDSAEIEAIGTREAGAEVAQQYEAWRGATLAGGGDSARLRLVTPSEQPAAPGAASTPATKNPKPGQSAAGTSAATGPEKAPDKNRLDVKSPELAALQQGNQAKQPPAATPAQQQPTPVEPPKAEQPPVAEPTPAAVEPAAQTPAATPPATIKSAPAQAEPSLLDRLGEMWWILVAGGLLIILGLLFVLLKKRRTSAAAAEQSFDVSGFTFEPRTRSSPQVSVDLDHEEEAEDEPTSTLSRREEAHSFDEEPDLIEEAPRTVVRMPTPAAVSKSSDDTMSSETAVRLDQQDALAEADFHMAYGLYDQAADLVKIAIAREPSRRDLKLKLLEIYFVWGNRDLFLETARELHDTSSQAPAGEWEKVLIMGKQIAPDDALFKGDVGGSRGLDMVDVNLEGGENRIDVDLFAEPEPEKPAGLDLEFTSGERKGPQGGGESNLDFLLDEPKRGDDGEATREYDSLSRTQETPTIESPMLDEEATNVEKLDVPGFGKAAASADQTAELSLDDLGLDVDSLESTGSLEETGAMDRTKRRADAALRDDEKTQLAPSLGSLEKTMQGPKFEKFDDEGTGTIYVADVDLSGSGDTVEQRGPEGKPVKLDVDLDNIDKARGVSGDTLRQRRIDPAADRFSSDVFANERSAPSKIDLDVGEPLTDEDRSPTNTQAVEMELSELEPVTMSEVGTKLDLARAYMDMGDPDGARSILDEVLQEGNAGQKQEAQRLLESIR